MMPDPSVDPFSDPAIDPIGYLRSQLHVLLAAGLAAHPFGLADRSPRAATTRFATRMGLRLPG